MIGPALLLATLVGSRITIEPAGKIYQDDVVTILVTSDKVLSDYTAGTRITTGNLTNVRREMFRRVPNAPPIVVFSATPIAPGLAWVEATISDYADKPVDQIPRVTFDVAPDLARASDDPNQIFRSQAAAKRFPLFIRTGADRARAFVGQRIEIWWEAVTTQKSLEYPTFYPKIENAPEISSFRSSSPLTVDASQPPPWHTQIVRLAVVAKKPGVLHVPERLIDLVDRAPDGTETRVRRWSTPVDIEAVPLPAEAARLPVGHFKIECRAVHERSIYWPSVGVDIFGSGDLTAIDFPRPVRTPYPIIVTKTDHWEAWDANHSRWIYEVHSHDPLTVTMPELTFEYFDPDAQKIEGIGCEKNPVLIRTDETPVAPAARMKDSDPVPPLRGDWHAPAIAGVFAAIGLAMVFFAMRR